MSVLTNADQKILQDLTCNVCECYLSVEPIRLIENAYVCGRCPGEGFRLKPMETLAKQFKYPCRYKEEGCQLYLKWGEAAGHERVCEFEKVNCIISDCDWMETKANMLKHFQNEHPTQVITKDNSIKLFEEKHKILKLLSSFNDAVFVIELCHGEKNIQCKVWMFLSKMNSSSYVYKIDFLTEKNRLTFLREVATAEIFHLDESALTSIFRDICNVSIKVNINYSDKMTITNEKLPELKCGHSVCSNCRKSTKQIVCSVCRQVYSSNGYYGFETHSSTRNCTLENFRDSFKNL